MAEKPICTIDGCSKPVRSGGLCNAHRIRLWRHGDASAGGRSVQTGPIEERFWGFVSKTPTGCWLWNGSLNNVGYGQIGVGFRQPNTLAHRVSWRIHFGNIPHGANVLHRCDTPSCVNPDHLFLGTQMTNMLDCKAKGRTTAGERNTQAKLTRADVVSIRRLAAAGLSLASIARKFNVSGGNISMIVSGKRWANVG